MVAVKPEVLLLDEPTSALDPISTAKIEELVNELKSDYTIAIVTHNMQQAARISDYTAYMYLGELVEFGETDQIFIKPTKKADRGLHHRPLRLIRTPQDDAWTHHIYKPVRHRHRIRLRSAVDRDGRASSERQFMRAVDAAAARRPRLVDAGADRRGRGQPACTCETDLRCNQMIAKRQPIAVDLREIIAVMHMINDLERIGDEAKKIALKVRDILAPRRRSRRSAIRLMADMVVEMLRRGDRRLRAAGQRGCGGAGRRRTRRSTRCATS